MTSNGSGLEGVIAKIDRAGKHIDTLHEELREWAERDPYTVWTEPKGEGRHHRLRIRFDPQPDPRRWGMLLGDAVHNLRSALDHLIYALAVTVEGDPPPGWRELQLPVLDNPDPDLWRRTEKRRLRGLTDEMRAVVKSVQPFEASPNEPHSDLLWVLAELDNTDKHRTINLVGILPAHVEVVVRTITPGPMTATYLPFMLEDEATIVDITGEAVTEVEDELNLAVALCIEQDGQRFEITTLTSDLFYSVAAVVHQFEQFF